MWLGLALAASLTVTAGTRLLIVAPHPDDEVLAAGGLMQRVRAAGGAVRVVYLTDGDGYPEGVKAEDRLDAPKPKDFRGYGKQRQKEARAALEALGLGDRGTATFLSFPDAGLCKLTRAYWSDKRRPYQSPYTKRDRPPRDEAIVPDTEYRGEDLSLELAAIVGDFRPTLILVPRPEDQHADHCAAWFFVKDAVADVQRIVPGYTPDVVNYVIHFGSWPPDDETRRTLPPPPGLRGGASGWIRFPLTPPEQRRKEAALKQYRSQMRVMADFLQSFARTNEVFSRPAPARVTLPTRRSPCCDQ